MDIHRLSVLVACLFSALVFSGTTQAVDYTGELNAEQYDVYYGDANQDGYDDIYFHPKKRIIILHGDIATPIVLPPAEGFIVFGIDYPPITTEPYLLTEAEIATRSLILATESTDYFYGDFNGDGIGDVIVRGISNTSIAVEISNFATTTFPSVTATYDTSDAPTGYNLSDRSNTFTIVDANNDGSDDLVVYSGGKPILGYLSGSGQLVFSSGYDFKLAAAKTVVGATAGDHSVDEDGSATYSIAIAAPEGIGGMQPNIALTYNSNTGNGHMGVGWNVSGLSSITRCPTDQDFGGTIDGVDFDGNDRYCLDGMPLVAISGTYGANGTEYRTRVESFTKIISYGSAGNCVRNGVNVPGPQKFKVWYPDGQIIEYGYTEDSRVQATGCNDVITWMINKQKDRFNNSVDYRYTENAGEHYINRIDYNGGNSSIRFNYSNRQHSHTTYYAGTSMQLTKLLKSITSYEGSEALREYILTYKTTGTSVFPRLSKLVECAKLDCLPATSFHWSSDPELDSGFDSESRSVSSNWGEIGYTFTGDFNGDGISDIASAIGGSVYMRLSSEGTTVNQTWNVAANWGEAGHTFAGDFNGDGYTDIASASGSNVYMKLSTGTSFNSSTWTVSNSWGDAEYIFTGDFNGDGLTDIASGSGSNVFMKLSTGSGFSSETWSVSNSWGYSGSATWVADFNGDGLADIASAPYAAEGVNVYMKLSTGSGFASEIWTVTNEWGTGGWAASFGFTQVGDFNGDGLMDIASRSGVNTYMKLSTGTGFVSANWLTPLIEDGDHVGMNHTKFGDFNADGLTDIVGFSGSNAYVRLSTGSGFKTGVWSVSDEWGVGTKFYRYCWAGDFDGDGVVDVASANGASLNIRKAKASNLTLDSVVNGMGVKTRFTYKNLTDPTVYTKGTHSPGYPLLNSIHSGQVISKVEISDGLGGFNGISYTYKNLRAHLKGLGELGFEEITVTDDDSGNVTTTVYSQDYSRRLQGSPLEVITKTTAGTKLFHAVNTFQLATWGSGNSYRYQVRKNLTTITKRDLNNAFLSKEVTDIVEYDSYGKPAETQISLYNASDVLQRSITVTTQYDNDTSNWFLGRVERTKVITHVPGRTDRVKVSTREYDATTGRLTKAHIRHPDTDAILNETRYGEDEDGIKRVDSFGNNLAITISGPDFVSRTSKATFDPTGRRTINKTDALNFPVSTEFYGVNDNSEGAYPHKPKIVTDANGLKVFTQYDAFGRVKTISSAWGTAAQVDATTEYRVCDNSCPANVTYYIVNQTEGSSEKRTYIDKLGRTLRIGTETVRVIGGTSSWAYVDYRYDHRGRNTHISEPYFSGQGPAHWTVFSYDESDRTTQTLYPDGRVDKVIYNGLLVTTRTDVNGKNQQNIAERNTLGELIKVTDNDGNILTYSYDSHGNLLTTTVPAAGGNQVSMTYDELGRKIAMNDPDKGAWSYTYNSLGQLITQTNARGEVICNVYDVLGRMIKRIDNYQGSVSTAIGQASESTDQCAGDVGNPETATWVYDTAAGAALGKLHKILGKSGYQNEVIYDSLGRPIETKKTINGVSYSTKTSYDNFSRPLTTTYPGLSNRLQIKNIYNQLGMLMEVRDAADNGLYYQVGGVDARGNVIYERFGNGVETTRAYKPTNGRLNNIYSFTPGSGTNNIQELEYTYDALGNLDYRQDFRNNFREDFIYDTLNRLKTATADFGNADIRTTSVTYDVLGNIRTKTGVGTYRYGSECANGFGPHAVCEISGTKNAVYTYDPNGNMTAGDGRTIDYTLFDKPNKIVRGNTITEISYGPTRSRYFRRDKVSGKVTEYTYVGGIYEKVVFKDDGVNINKTEERHYIGDFAVLTIEGRDAQSAGTRKTRYLHKDHIGSVTTITNEIGQIVDEFSFDAWGKRRAPSLDILEFLHGPWSSLNANQKNNLTTVPTELGSSITNLGFTGHEQMDPVGLIHMNGRVYDAELGRFIQADPIIQSPLDLQSYNRFSYVRNNPLSLVDPSGYGWLSKQWKKAKRGIKKIGKELKRFGRRVDDRFHKWGHQARRSLKRLDDSLRNRGVYIGASVDGGGNPTYHVGDQTGQWSYTPTYEFTLSSGSGLSGGASSGRRSSAVIFANAAVPQAIRNEGFTAGYSIIYLDEYGGEYVLNGDGSRDYYWDFFDMRLASAQENSGARRFARRQAARNAGTTTPPDIKPGVYPVIAVSFSGTVMPGTLELTDLYMIDVANERVYFYGSIAGGAAAGYAGTAGTEFGAVYMESYKDLAGFSGSLEHDGIAVFGGSASLEIPVALPPTATKFTAGPAVGAGIGYGAVGGYTWFKKSWTFGEFPHSWIPVGQ